MKIDQAKAEQAIKDLLVAMGVNNDEEPYKGTANRYYRFLEELFGDRDEKIKVFPEECHGGPIMLTGHRAWTLCPHHLLPVEFIVDVSYTPKRVLGNSTIMVLGLSKLPRLINQAVRKGPALQEKLTQDIALGIAEYADEVHVMVKGEHACTTMRGVKTSGLMVTEYHYVSEEMRGRLVRPKIVPVN